MNAIRFSSVEARAAMFDDRTRHLDTIEFLRAVFAEDLLGRLAVVSSFGAESAVLLHLISQVKPDAEVLFLDTGKLFGQTRRYQRDLSARLGLTNVRIITPDGEALQEVDPKGTLWASDTNACCFHRKVVPLETALKGVDCWISGRKRYQAASRAHLPRVEAQDGKIKLNPLAGWTAEEVQAYFEDHDLPSHPLVAEGYLSIGCMPCTDRVNEGEDARAGRWRGRAKSECGIHLGMAQARRVAGRA